MKTVGQYNIIPLIFGMGFMFIPLVTPQMESCPNSPRSVNVDDFKIYEAYTGNNSVLVESINFGFIGVWEFMAPDNIDVLTEMVTLRISYHLDAHETVCSFLYKPYIAAVDDEDENQIQEKYLPKSVKLLAGVGREESNKCTNYKAGQKGILVFQLNFDSFENDGYCVFAETKVIKND